MRNPVPDIYPPISRFQSGVGESQLRSAICSSNDDPVPRRLALTLRIPDARDPEFQSDMARVHREVDLVSRLIDRDREVIELHIDCNDLTGPFPIEAVRDLAGALWRLFHFSASETSEYAIALHPRAIRAEQLECLVEEGFNRVVFTVVPLEPAIVCSARNSGMRSIGIVVASETEASECARSLRPDRLSFQRPVDESTGCEQRSTDLDNGMQLAGYLHLGLGHYALLHDDLAMAFMGYRLEYGLCGFTAHAECDVIGFGPGAVSRVGGYLSQNSASCADWRYQVDSGRLPANRGLWLTPDDELRGELMQQLLCRRQIEIRTLERHYVIDFRSYFAADLARLAPCLRLGMVRDLDDRIAVCSRGWPWLRKIAQCFDAGAGDRRLPQETWPRL